MTKGPYLDGPAAANVELVRAGFQAFNAGDIGECLARIAPDLIINLAELPEPLAEVPQPPPVLAQVAGPAANGFGAPEAG